MSFHLYLHQPTAVMRARVNVASPTYPMEYLQFDGVTLGAYTDVEDGMFFTVGSTVDGDDKGRGRVKNQPTSTAINMGRVSQGTNDGELDVADNDYITVWFDYRIHALIPYISDANVMYKDGGTAVSTNTTTPPPVANTGPGFAATINSGTSLITVAFDGGTSFAVANGATITTYLWNIEDGTATVGTINGAALTVTFPAGFRWITLTVTDSNARTHSARCPVFARDPNSDATVDHYVIEAHTVSQMGQKLNIRILEDLPRTTYPDGCLVMFWEDEPLSAADRTHMQFIGWHQSDQVSVTATRTGNIRDTVLECVDAAGRLNSLPGFPQVINRANTPDKWSDMYLPTMDKFIHYMLYWHSKALEVVDFLPSGTGDSYPFVVFTAYGESIYSQINNQAKMLVPDHLFTCNRRGQLAIVADPMLQNTADRTATVQGTFTEQYTQDIQFAYTRPPKVHWIRGNALLTATDYTDVAGVDTLFEAHCIAPGAASGQGVSLIETNEQLARSQADLNAVTGHRYARMNSRYGLVTITPPDGANYTQVDPATMDWVNFTVSADTAAQRGITFTNARTQCKQIDIKYIEKGTGIVRKLKFTLEIETVGLPARTVTPEITESPTDTVVGAPPVSSFTPGAIDPIYYSGDMQAFVLWDGAHVYRTWDIQAASPTWALIDTGITGNIYDGQYVHVTADTVGMWLMTSTAIWWCSDILATTPSWSSVLPIATVRAADVVPTTGLVGFKTMFNYALQPGYAIVATGPVAGDATNLNYQHAYYWYTSNYGANWTQVDMNSYLLTGASGTRGFTYTSLYAMNIYRSAPGTIWCIRSTPLDGLQSEERVFYSSDLGATWTMGVDFNLGINNNLQIFSLLNPFPSATDPSYATAGTIGAADLLDLYVSTDGWATKTLIAKPTGYDGLSNLWRVNKRTFDNTHILGWFRNASDDIMHLLQSVDSGATWSLLYNSALTEQTVPNLPTGSVTAARHNTPNGWPNNVNQWAVVRGHVTSGSTTAAVQLTLDNFTTRLDKSGNLNTLLGGANWTNGPANGFALPKVGANT